VTALLLFALVQLLGTAAPSPAPEPTPAWQLSYSRDGGFAAMHQAVTLDANGQGTTSGFTGGNRSSAQFTATKGELANISGLVAAASPAGWKRGLDECCDRRYIVVTLRRGKTISTAAWMEDDLAAAPLDALGIARALARHEGIGKPPKL
jgi:hypothetical protein